MPIDSHLSDQFEEAECTTSVQTRKRRAFALLTCTEIRLRKSILKRQFKMTAAIFENLVFDRKPITSHFPSLFQNNYKFEHICVLVKNLIPFWKDLDGIYEEDKKYSIQ